MNEFQKLLTITNQLGVSPESYLLAGSAVMFLHDIQREKPMGDVDIFVPTRTWFEMQKDARWKVWTTNPHDKASRCDPPYLVREVEGLEVNVFFGWRRRGIGDIDVNLWFANAEVVRGFRCVPLPMILHWKEEMGRAKDLTDILLLRAHFLGGSEAATA
jgi:hypothetical protein